MTEDDIIKPETIIYEDSHIIVLIKPQGVPVQGDKTRDASMYDYVKDYIKIRYKKPGNVYLGIVHRLDRPVAGIMVFAKTSKAAGRLSEAIRARKFEKIYHAVVSGIPFEKEARLSQYLVKKTNKLNNIAQIVFEGTEGAKLALLDYKVLASDNIKNISLLEVKIETGRFHQIRAQLASQGHPIFGDIKYGWQASEDITEASLALFASSISFEHPTQNKLMSFSVNIPSHYPWTLFENKNEMNYIIKKEKT